MARKRSSRDINIPLDLMVEILKKLPTKSLARFQCVSYHWESIIKDFIVIDSIVTRSLTQPPRDPHFIFDIRSSSEAISIFSYAYLYHQITNEEQLYHEETFGKRNHQITNYLSNIYHKTKFQYVRGLIGFSCYSQFNIHNPTTRQSFSLPMTRLPRSNLSYLFGYDPFKKQYKVLCMTHIYPPEQSFKVFILGDPSKQWWDIKCSIGSHFPFEQAVCINGAIYYKARTDDWTNVFVSFDVGSEKFDHVQAPEILLSDHGYLTLVNYQGKLGCICRNNHLNNKDVDMWVMENAEKQEWSKVTFFSMLQDLPTWEIIFAGVTHPSGEIVIVHQEYLSELALDVYYYDPKQKSRRRVEIQTTTSLLRIKPSDIVRVWAVTDHVENIMGL